MSLDFFRSVTNEATEQRCNISLPPLCYSLLRLYSVLGREVADDSWEIHPSTPTTSTTSTTPTSQVLVGVGIIVGLLALGIAVLCALYIRHRRRRKSAQLDARATPPHDAPLAPGDALSDAPQESEHHSQPTQPLTHGSTLSSSAPTATAVPTKSFSINESGTPPSHLGLTFPVGRSSRSGAVAKMGPPTPTSVIEILDEDDEKGDELRRAPRWWDVNQSRGTQE